MKRYVLQVGRIVTLMCVVFSFSVATSIADGLLVYKPSQVGAPSSRIGGGTRGLILALEGMQALAPGHAALTSVPGPSLYWRSSKQGKQSVHIVVINQETNEPLIDRNLAFDGGGYQSIRLKEYGVALKDDVEYRWSVAQVEGGGIGYGGVNATGTIVHRKPGVKITTAEDYAQIGYWYDALEMLMNDGSSKAKERLQSLLEQGGIQSAE